MELEGAVGIVTGASRGIGVYIAEALARKGADLALAARTASDLEETVARMQGHGVRAIAVATDVTKRDDLERLVKTTESELGPPTLLVNNAGIDPIGEFVTLDPDVIERVIATNVLALQMLTRFVVPGMVERKRGHVVNIGSLSGKTVTPYYTVYGSSKHAVVGFSLSLREELRPHGVGVSVVCPTFVREVGGFATRNPKADAPSAIGTVAPKEVAAAVVRAIEKDLPEVVLANGLTKVADVALAISPRFTAWMGRRLGGYDFLAREARRSQHD